MAYHMGDSNFVVLGELVFYHKKEVLLGLHYLRLMATIFFRSPLNSAIIDSICIDLIVDEFT